MRTGKEIGSLLVYRVRGDTQYYLSVFLKHCIYVVSIFHDTKVLVITCISAHLIRTNATADSIFN